jgi:hypothetical protein
MTSGYIYCMSNPAMPGMLKIGYTERSPKERLQEANLTCTWIPLDFSIEFAKHVKDPNKKEQTIHTILAEKRVNPKREFFRVTREEVKLLFELVDGSWWNPDEIDIESRVHGDNVIRLFLDKHIYPSKPDDPPVSWNDIAVAFQTWKREAGHTSGNTAKVRDFLISAYGEPQRGSWSTIRLVSHTELINSQLK